MRVGSGSMIELDQLLDGSAARTELRWPPGGPDASDDFASGSYAGGKDRADQHSGADHPPPAPAKQGRWPQQPGQLGPVPGGIGPKTSA